MSEQIDSEDLAWAKWRNDNSIRGISAEPMQLFQAIFDCAGDLVETACEDRRPCNQHEIVAGGCKARKNEPRCFTHASLGTIANDGIPQSLGCGETDANLVIPLFFGRGRSCMLALHALENQDPACELPATGGTKKLRPLAHPDKFGAVGPLIRRVNRRQAESRLRPRARRALITLRPPTVAMRERNPCRRLRTSRLG